MVTVVLYILLGLIAGITSGFIGIGGGVIIVPFFVFLFGFTQQQAQGTTLALMVPPIGLLAAWVFYRQGFVNVKAAAYMCMGFFVGGLLGARFASNLSNPVLQKIFGAVLLLIALKMIFNK
jgi:uncharacterized membrane protein YfcA